MEEARSLERCGAPPGVQTGQDRLERESMEWYSLGTGIPCEQGSKEQHPTEQTDNKQEKVSRAASHRAKKKLSREQTEALARVVREALLRD